MRPYERIAARNPPEMLQVPISRWRMALVVLGALAIVAAVCLPVAWVVAYLAGWV